MDHREVGRYWDENADAWVELERAGYNVAREYLIDTLRIGFEEAHLPEPIGSALCKVKEPPCNVDPDHAPLGTDTLCQLENRLASTAADVDDHVATHRGQGVDRAHPQGGQLEVQKLENLGPCLRRKVRSRRRVWVRLGHEEFVACSTARHQLQCLGLAKTARYVVPSRGTIVRCLQQEDAEQARELLRKVDLESDPVSTADRGFDKSRAHFDFLASDCFWFLAAERQGELVGYGTAARIPKASSLMGTLYIDELHVLRPHRRHGIGSALVREVQRIAQDLGYWRVRLVADHHDPAIRRFYESLGFRDQNDGFFQSEVRQERGLG